MAAPAGITPPPTPPSLADPANFAQLAAAFVAWQANFVNNEWENLDPSVFFAVQSAPDALEAGNLMPVGAFGIGIPLDSGNINNRTTYGNYFGYGGAHVSATAGTNPFPNLNGPFTLSVENHGLGGASEYIVQRATSLNPAAPQTVTRLKTTDAAGWSDWLGPGVISKATISAATTVIGVSLPSGFRRHLIDLTGLFPTTNNSSLALRTSSDGGSNMDQGASDYSWIRFGMSDGTFSPGQDPADNEFEFSFGVGQADQSKWTGYVEVWDAADSSLRTTFRTWGVHRNIANLLVQHFHSGRREATQADNYLEIYFAGDTIGGGEVTVTGIV